MCLRKKKLIWNEILFNTRLQQEINQGLISKTENYFDKNITLQYTMFYLTFMYKSALRML